MLTKKQKITKAKMKTTMTKNKTFYIADTHFGHANIIKYCNRPFTDIYHMTEVLVNNWNSVVSEDDEVYMVGDFTLTKNKEIITKLVSRLNGHIYLVMGNHDYLTPQEYLDCGFEKVYDKPIIVGYLIISHEPLFMNSAMPYFNIYGHVHNRAEYKDRTENSWCVSVERINYTPAEFVPDAAPELQ